MPAFFAPERLEQPTFTIRGYLPGDGAALSDAVVPSYAHLRPWLPWPAPEQSVSESEVLVRRFRADLLTGADFTLGIFSPGGDRLLGGTGYHLRGVPLAHAQAEIGMWVRADEAGRGLGTAVLRALLAWGLSDAWPFQRLEWRCDVDNTASVRTAEGAGMRREGVLRGEHCEVSGGRRDTAVFGLLRGDLPGDGAQGATT